jgi:patatin-like phospholipase/acyl hydrolase
MGQTFQILSLDGGGVRGLFSAAILSSIEQDLKTNIQDHFDLIVGTSTGGIIAIGLGLGLESKLLVDFYVRHCSQIFKNPFRLRSALQWIRRKYPAEPLNKAVHSVLGDKLFGQSAKRLVIPSYNLGADDVYLFRTPHHARLKRDWRVPAWQVALATAAAPTFFPAFRSIGRHRLIDGGVWANNPAMVGLVEAVGTLEVEMPNIKILSIGTYDAINTRPERLDKGGKISWSRDAAAVDVILRAQSIGVSNQVRFLLGTDRFLRIDPRVPGADISLDEPCQADDLISRAAHHSRIFMPEIERIFCGHTASPYQPLYKMED